MAKKMTKSRKIVNKAMREVYSDTPKAVVHTYAKSGAARANKQRVAIGLDKARRKGARIPKAKKGY